MDNLDIAMYLEAIAIAANYMTEKDERRGPCDMEIPENIWRSRAKLVGKVKEQKED